MEGSRAAAPIEYNNRGSEQLEDLNLLEFTGVYRYLLEFAFFEKHVIDRQMDGQTIGRKISLFYKTLPPIGAAALLPSKKTEKRLITNTI